MTQCSSSRLSGSVCNDISLNVQFLNCGTPADPYALKSIKIYKCSVNQANLVTEVVLPCVEAEDRELDREYIYGGAIRRCGNQNSDTGECGTDLAPNFTPGCFILDLNLCPDLFEAGVYYDVWEFVGDYCDPCIDPTDVTNATDITCEVDDLEPVLSKCNQFFVSDQCWNIEDGLRSINLGFEPLSSRFQQPEKRSLEVGLTPLPLYENNVSFMTSIISSLSATITIQTASYEVLVDAEEMCIGLRTGNYRSNPYLLKYLLDTSRFLKGTYKYRIDIQLPNGETRSSPYYNLAIR